MITVDDLRGWHLVSAEDWTKDYYRIFITKKVHNYYKSKNAYCRKTVLTTARELGYLTRNGYTILL